MRHKPSEQIQFTANSIENFAIDEGENRALFLSLFFYTTRGIKQQIFQHADGLGFPPIQDNPLRVSARPLECAKRTVPPHAYPPSIGFCIHLLFAS
jgi:hypothetical protein